MNPNKIGANKIGANKNGAVADAVFGAPTRGTAPLRLALAGATRSGSAGVGNLCDPPIRLSFIQRESIGTTIIFRPAAMTNLAARWRSAD